MLFPEEQNESSIDFKLPQSFPSARIKRRDDGVSSLAVDQPIGKTSGKGAIRGWGPKERRS